MDGGGGERVSGLSKVASRVASTNGSSEIIVAVATSLPKAIASSDSMCWITCRWWQSGGDSGVGGGGGGGGGGGDDDDDDDNDRALTFGGRGFLFTYLRKYFIGAGDGDEEKKTRAEVDGSRWNFRGTFL